MATRDIPVGLSFDDVLLVPQRTSVVSRSATDVSTVLVGDLRLRTPILSANTPWCTGASMAMAMANAGGVGVLHRMQTAEQQVADLIAVKKETPESGTATVDRDGRLCAGGAIGVTDDWLERAGMLVDAGVDFLVTDVAHGHADYVMAVVERLKEQFPDVPVVAGNVATAAGTRDLIDAGADAVKVGIGPGGICTTRIVAGSGVPQLTAVLDCAGEAERDGIPVIADGGIKEPGDVVKALAAGARSVMLGSALAGADESEALLVEGADGTMVKVSTGFVTFGMRLTLKRSRGEAVTREELEAYTPEGVEAAFAYSGAVAQTLRHFVGGLRSGMSYSGAHTLAELRERAQFVRITPAGLTESRPHALQRAEQVPLDYGKEAVG
ncbi:IMP dehydrogenase [Streptomyces ossamyceticus]|uniref:IMP dehydrogenase n=1 Tax=Streptomyces TaxID=1883 RepID=UPI0007C7EFE0|nr:IMP dehydrogenase [Streptomyces neyagawaensis]MCL6739230.1 IMP dehydrogenase [Streptomyces neyagawaensis]MDE1688826.1 IMP dehydrogenase [Streptomyces neyagawaensis]